MSKESFKDFARLHPELATQVVNNKISWQKLYELYDIYGTNSSVWNTYLQSPSKEISKETTLNDIVTTIKGVDLNSSKRNTKYAKSYLTFTRYRNR